MKRGLILLLLFILALAIPMDALADEVGCCTNPGASALTCSTERLAKRDKECCPTPESNFSSYYKSQQIPFGPVDYKDCTGKFFFPAQGCSGIGACAFGCCCSEIGGGEIKSKAQCQSQDLTFYEGETDCKKVCGSVPQCSDGIDNDNNGCADFGKDSGCSSPADNDESGGTCLHISLSCSDLLYTPKLSALKITPAKGEQKFLLQWQDECNAVSYDILRCKGHGCTNFEFIGAANKNSFEDASDLLFDTTYTYQIKSHYSLQTATPTITGEGSLGNLECLGQFSNDNFCIYQAGDKFNKAFFCDAFNKLTPEGTSCSSDQFCVVENNKPKCLKQINCNYEGANPFGLFYTLEGCEKDRYCFYDRSYTIQNSCFGCTPSMSCYDYKTEETCGRDNCGIRNCKWKNLDGQIGIGACIRTGQYNCKWCEKKGTDSLENTKSFNEVFDFCTEDKSSLLSEGAFKCYFTKGQSKNCNEVVCSTYNTTQCSDSQIVHDENNNIRNPSKDKCGIGVCQNINSACVKNADGDSKPDCSDTLCENDYFAPNTTLLSTLKKGVVDSLIVVIYDKTSINGSVILRASGDYSTFLCLEPCGSDGHPYDSFTKSRRIIISNLNAFDSDNGNKILSLREGMNTIRYYSQDAARNIGEVKKIAIEAHSDTSGPRVLSINISDSSNVLGVIYTNKQKPTIEVHFFEPAVITFARLVNKKTGSIFSFSPSSEINKDFNLEVTGELIDGKYTFELNAKNTNGKFMDTPFSAPIVIDSVSPTVNITPSNGAVLNSSNVSIRLSFDEEVNLESVIINSGQFKNLFSTINNKIFFATVKLDDGDKSLQVIARDYAKNQVSSDTFFIVDANPTTITLLNPKFGTAPSYKFDLVAETDNNAECRFSLDTDFDFNVMDNFKVTGGTIHSFSDFDQIANGDTSTHKLIIKCKDNRGITSKSFDINVDSSPPIIINSFAYPNPIGDKPAITLLTVETNEPAICKYSSVSKEFSDMGGMFDGFNNKTFKIINKQNVSLDNEGNFVYFIACQNKAGLVSNTGQIDIAVDFSIAVKIISHTPEVFNSTNVFLSIETNKKTQCQFSETDKTARSGQIFGQVGYKHIIGITSTDGKHTFYTVCKDQSSLKYSDVAAISFTVDTTPPSMIFVNDTSTFELFPEQTCLTDRLRVKWLGEDAGVGIQEYFYSLIRNKDNKTILDFVQSFISGEWIWVQDLSLEDSAKYSFKVKAKDFVSLVSVPKSSDGITVDTSLCKAQPFCGDGNLDKGELCDPDKGIMVFGPINKCTDYSTFIGGNLGCHQTTCMPDTTDCIQQPFCGDKIIQKGEHCDGSLFGAAKACSDLGFASGTLSCTPSCFLDTSKCVPKTKCGNGMIDQGEQCDGTNLGPLTGQCAQYSTLFTGGTLKCINTTCKLDTSGCAGIPSPPGTCGDGIINIGETCDGTLLGSIDKCTDYKEFSGGNLTCTSCQINTNACIPKPKCGNGIIDQKEECDGNNLGILNGECAQYSPYFSGGTLNCNSECKLDTFGCVEAPLCGNGRLDDGEECDKSNFGIINGNCTSFSNEFLGGELICSRNCKIDTSACVKVNTCGNGLVEPSNGETCDGTNFKPLTGTCTNYSTDFQSGNLKCIDCQISTANCTERPPCGNGRIDHGETCDGTLGLGDGLCITYSANFSAGSLKCTSCQINTSGCTAKPGFCGDNTINAGEACDGATFGSIKSCTDYPDFIGGVITCSGCKLNTSECIPKPPCGNGKLDTGEQCDGNKFGAISDCTDYSNFIGGDIDCTTNCKLNLGGCIDVPTCGNGKIDPKEDCDGTLFGAITKCTDYKEFASGTLKCKTITCQLDTAGCVEKPKCGNGMIDQGEQCDGTSFGPLDGTCKGYDGVYFTGGKLLCTPQCKISTENCQGNIQGTCGDGILKVGEECDGATFGIISNCNDYREFSGGTLSCSQCGLDTSKCSPIPKCSNNFVNTGESCDNNNFDSTGNQCRQYSPFFSSGLMTCTSKCQLDTAGCAVAEHCGNGVIDGGEQCDGTNFDGVDTSCAKYSTSFINGTLKCDKDCQISTENCVKKPDCGNGIINSGETCDGTNLDSLDGLCASYSSNFTSGSLKCTNCQIDTSSCKGVPPGICGDNTINAGEECDGDKFGAIKKCTDYQEFAGGTLKCNPATCKLDTSLCIEKGCGNSYIDTGEECDGTIFGAIKKCSDISIYEGGVLSCTRNCSLDVSGCVKGNPKICGDGDIDAGEICDDKGPVFGAIKSCTYFNNFIGGILGCNRCQLDTTGCIKQPFCGDKIIQKGEHCDDGLLGAVKSCIDLGFVSGTLNCASNCFLDTSKCVPKPKCGNGLIDPGEDCEGTNLGPLTGQCAQYSSLFTGGTLKCGSNCKLDTSQCFGTVGKCGDGIINIGEACDNTTLGVIKDCKSYGNFTEGIISCSNCQLNTSSCIPKPLCGNGLIDTGEECDGNNLGILSTSCASYTSLFTGGTLRCSDDCTLDTFNCQEAQKCGNGLLDAGETCDGSNFGNITDLSCSRYSTSFINGNLSCVSCQISTRNCNTNITTQITCKDRGDCKLGEQCTDNSDCESRFCINNKCTNPSCSDLKKNQDESDIDCGGSCGKCQNDKTCRSDANCQSGLCSFGFCKTRDACHDEKLSPGESDIDCGGVCPTKCQKTKHCDSDADCAAGAECASSECKSTNNASSGGPCTVNNLKDTDCDGMPDIWEIENGLNPNNASDANSDPDSDGLTNLQEYQTEKVYGKSTNPNKADTDGDGFADKLEMDKGTNPIDPLDFPKSSLKKVLLFVLGIAVLISGFGYLAYRVVEKRREEEFELPRQRETPRVAAPPPQFRIPLKQRGREETKIVKESLRLKEEQKQKEREKLFGAFGEPKETPKVKPEELKEQKTEKPEQKEIKEAVKETKKSVEAKKIRIKKPKEDVFVKLKEMAKKEKNKK